MWILRFDFEGMHASIFRVASASRNQSASYPLSPKRTLAFGKASIISAAPPKSLICPSLSSRISGRPFPSHTACSLEFKPPLVLPYPRRLAAEPHKTWYGVSFFNGTSPKLIHSENMTFRIVYKLLTTSLQMLPVKVGSLQTH